MPAAGALAEAVQPIPVSLRDHDRRPSPERRDARRTAGLIAWSFFDWANSSYSAIIATFVFAAYFTRSVAPNEVDGAALWGYTVGAAGLVIAVAGPVLGALADQIGRRKPLLAAFSLLCIIPTGFLWLIKPSPAYMDLALVLIGISTIGTETASIFYNAMLPGLARQDNIGRWSGWAWGLGYAGGVMSMIVALFAFIESDLVYPFDHSTAQHVRATFVLAAAWYLVFALPLFLITPDGARSDLGLTEATRRGLRQLHDTLRNVRHYADIARFLIARLLFIDGLATLFAFGGVYAAGAFNMNEQQVLIFGIMLNVTAGLGAAAFAWLDDHLGPKQTIIYSLIGLIVFASATLLTHSLDLFWGFGLALGVFVGPVQASSRSYLARVAPPDLRTQMFGLMALSGKATAFIGPVLVGTVTHLAGNQRAGMGVIVVFFTLGLLLMLKVPRASTAAAALHQAEA